MTEKTLHQKLNEIQQKIKVHKSQYNSFGKYSYRSCEDILEALKPLLDDLTVQLIDEVVQIGDRYYIKAQASLHDGKDKISTFGYARESEDKKGMDSAQITGSASSYARKYALAGLLALDDGKDADSMDNREDRKSNENKPLQNIVHPSYREDVKATEKQIQLISILLNVKGQDVEDLYKKYKVTSRKELSRAQASTIIENLQKLPDES